LQLTGDSESRLPVEGSGSCTPCDQQGGTNGTSDNQEPKEDHRKPENDRHEPRQDSKEPEGDREKSKEDPQESGQDSQEITRGGSRSRDSREPDRLDGTRFAIARPGAGLAVRW
jgi:hypothetical protein